MKISRPLLTRPIRQQLTVDQASRQLVLYQYDGECLFKYTTDGDRFEFPEVVHAGVQMDLLAGRGNTVAFSTFDKRVFLFDGAWTSKKLAAQPSMLQFFGSQLHVSAGGQIFNYSELNVILKQNDFELVKQQDEFFITKTNSLIKNDQFFTNRQVLDVQVDAEHVVAFQLGAAARFKRQSQGEYGFKTDVEEIPLDFVYSCSAVTADGSLLIGSACGRVFKTTFAMQDCQLVFEGGSGVSQILQSGEQVYVLDVQGDVYRL